MKKKLVKSEKMESNNQNTMSMQQKLDVISEDLKQIKKYHGEMEWEYDKGLKQFKLVILFPENKIE